MDTNLDDGDTQIACASCLPAYALGLAAAVTSQLAPEQRDSLADGFAAVAANAPQGAAARPARAKAKAAKAPPAELAPDGPRIDAAVPVALEPPCDSCGSQLATGGPEQLVCDGCGKVLATVPPAAAPADDSQEPVTTAH